MKQQVASGIINAFFIVLIFFLLRKIREEYSILEALYFSNFYLLLILSCTFSTLKIEYTVWFQDFSTQTRDTLIYVPSLILSSIIIVLILMAIMLFGVQMSGSTILAIVLAIINGTNYVRLISWERLFLASIFRSVPITAAMLLFVSIDIKASIAISIVLGFIFIISMRSLIKIKELSQRSIMLSRLFNEVFSRWSVVVLDGLNFLTINSLFFFSQIFFSSEVAQNVFEYSRVVGAPWNLLLLPISQKIIYTNISANGSDEENLSLRYSLFPLTITAFVYFLILTLGFTFIAQSSNPSWNNILGEYDFLLLCIVYFLVIPRSTIGLMVPNLYRSISKSRSACMLSFVKLFSIIMAFLVIFPFGIYLTFIAIVVVEIIYFYYFKKIFAR